MIQKLPILLFSILFSSIVLGQNPTIQTAVDSTKIKIGAQINLTLKTTVPKESVVTFPERNNFGALEVIESYPVDTIKQDQTIELIKKYGLTQFDSGHYTIPRLSVIINNRSYLTDSVQVVVNNVAVDTLKQKMYDIKSIINIESKPDYSWLWYLLLIPGAALIYFLIKAYKPKEKAVEEVFTSPIEKATALLSRLEEKQLWQKGDVKPYYSELTEIVRTYIEEAIEIPAMESTSSEVIDGLKKAFKSQKIALSKETLLDLNKVLQNADLVKFAKSMPLEFEIVNDRKTTETILLTLDKTIPKKSEEEAEEEHIAQKQKTPLFTKQRIIIGAVASIVIVYIGLGILFYNDGLGGITSLFGRKSSKRILETEWLTSDYGYPSIKIETPEVLTRLKSNGTKEQLFQVGTIEDEFFVQISSTPLLEKDSIDLNVVTEKAFSYLERQGAQNILINEDDFQLEEDISGKKAFGSLSMPLPESQEQKRIRFEMLIFKQDKALQQIVVFYNDNNEFSEKVKQRIINSVAIEKTSK